MIKEFKICDQCLEKHLSSVDAFEKANPDASVDEWVSFWEKNSKWQERQIKAHCYKNFYAPVSIAGYENGKRIQQTTDAVGAQNPERIYKGLGCAPFGLSGTDQEIPR